MKNSDMKVIAIILAIALCLTVLTSNVVSIASVVILAKGGTVVEAGTSTDADASADSSSSSGTQTPAGSSGTQTQTPTGDSTATTAASGNTDATQAPSGNTDATQAPAGDSGAQTTSKIDKEALAMFQNAAKAINEQGIAGYSYKSWQKIESINVGGNDSLKTLIEGFLTKEEDAETKVQEKGSEDAMRRMPISNCSESTIESVTKTASGSNVVVTIVMKDVTNPAKTDTDGLNLMSRDFLYMEDVHETVKTNSAVKLLVRSLDKGEITYKAYTIKATMTADGKFVEITHQCNAELVANAKLIVGSIEGDGVLQFNVKYWDFKY